MPPKRIGLIALFVIVATAAYVFYVSQYRAASIRNFISDPRPGDVYKLQTATRDMGVSVVYLKVKSVDGNHINFYPSRMVASGLHDNFLKHFDTTQIRSYTRSEMAAIAAGKWLDRVHDNTRLVEIERK